MKSSEKTDRFFKFASWLIVIALIYAAASMWFFPPSAEGPVAGAIGVLGGQIFYTVLYLAESASLAYSKFAKRNTWRKNSLLVIYLTGFFTSVLTVLLGGLTPKALDNLVIATVAAACWLYWTFKTEYLTSDQFSEVCREGEIL